MKHSEEFLNTFICPPPEFLPQSISENWDFLSCFSHKEGRWVFLIRRKGSEEKAILKITGKDSINNLTKEYEILSKLDHPSIPKVLSLDKDSEGREFLIRTYMEGETLDVLLERDGEFSKGQTLEITQKICGVLSYLHHQNPAVIYRDIKPQNIVLTPNGKVSLIDFGISREFRSDQDFDTVYVGSVAFASPEQFGFTKTDSRSDVFGLGRLMTYLLTLSTDQQHAKIEDKDLNRLIQKCTQLSPEKRYTSVEALSKEIHRLLNPPTRKEIMVGVAAAVVIVASGLFAWSSLNHQEKEKEVASLLSANGEEVAQEVKIPVKIQALENGKPLQDCAVAVDNHHWFQPSHDGWAQLFVYAFEEYKLRVVQGNRQVFLLNSITKEGQSYEFALDIGAAPTASEAVFFTSVLGKEAEFPLDITGAEEVNLGGAPESITVENREGRFFLNISKDLEEPGYYTLLADAVNKQGKADFVIALHIPEEKPVTIIHTAEELSGIRNDLSGYYELASDIHLDPNSSWVPIGTGELPFTGILDGKGHSITGLSIPLAGTVLQGPNGLFGVMKQGVIKNLILREPQIHIAHQGVGGSAALVGISRGGLIENCAVLGGFIKADIGLESSAGGVCGVNQGVLRKCFNSAEVTIYTEGSKNWTESMAGGICGTNNGYLADCGNGGDVTGIALAGGVAGFNDMGILTRCYNAGRVQAPSYLGRYPAGGIAQLLGRGKINSYSCFQKGTAQVGSTVFNGGTLLGLIPLEKEDFRDLESLNQVFRTKESVFAYASAVSYYPLPKELFQSRLPTPSLPKNGGEIHLPPQEGLLYFYTLDGSDPKNPAAKGVEEATIHMEKGQTLRVFTSAYGYWDSEEAVYKAK